MRRKGEKFIILKYEKRKIIEKKELMEKERKRNKVEKERKGEKIEMADPHVSGLTLCRLKRGLTL